MDNNASLYTCKFTRIRFDNINSASDNQYRCGLTGFGGGGGMHLLPISLGCTIPRRDISEAPAGSSRSVEDSVLLFAKELVRDVTGGWGDGLWPAEYPDAYTGSSKGSSVKDCCCCC